ncbi:MAG: hypothetical protein ABA06_00855 [Parcubacteria bacterium C7867-001]|nr:MAG: hypothetical protein ABA06_00855 [Parcubacteria bacterium C7867-001]
MFSVEHIDTDRVLAPGERVIYFRGYLAKYQLGTYGVAGVNREWAWKQHREGRAILVQRRMGPNDFEYIAIGRARPERKDNVVDIKKRPYNRERRLPEL